MNVLIRSTQNIHFLEVRKSEPIEKGQRKTAANIRSFFPQKGEVAAAA